MYSFSNGHRSYSHILIWIVQLDKRSRLIYKNKGHSLVVKFSHGWPGRGGVAAGWGDGGEAPGGGGGAANAGLGEGGIRVGRRVGELVSGDQ